LKCNACSFAQLLVPAFIPAVNLTYIMPFRTYGCETWATTKYLCDRIDTFDTWPFRKIVTIPFCRNTSNAEVSSVMMFPSFQYCKGSQPEIRWIHCAQCSSQKPPLFSCCHHLTGNGRRENFLAHGLIRTTESNLRPLNVSSSYAWK